MFYKEFIMTFPIQPIENDEHGTARFKENKVVSYLLDNGSLDLNQLMSQNFPKADMEQFAQLIGYSLGGFSELSYVSNETYETALAMHEQGLSEAEARNNYLRAQLQDIKSGIRETACKIFNIHPDDLTD